MGAESSSSPQYCPLMDKLIRPTVHNKISKGGFNCDAAKKKQYSLPGTSRPCYPLSGLQRLLRNFRKPDQLEEPKIVGLSIIIENSWSYNCCKYQSRMESCCKSKPQILNKSMLAAQCKVRSTNDGSMCRNSVLLTPPSVVSSNVVASTTLPAIDFLDECYLCKRSLGPGLDTYMYRGDRAFCSVECRLKQIAMDEPRDKTASAALQRPVRTTSPRTRRSDKNRTHVVQGRGILHPRKRNREATADCWGKLFPVTFKRFVDMTLKHDAVRSQSAMDSVRVNDADEGSERQQRLSI